MTSRKRIAGYIAAAVISSSMATSGAAPIGERIGEVRLLHGGIGVEDRFAMTRAADEYNLRLTFATHGSGAYLADVQVVINDARGGKVAGMVSSGPWLFARLAPGDYTIVATSAGSSLTHKVTIKGAAARDWVFRFERPAEQ